MAAADVAHGQGRAPGVAYCGRRTTWHVAWIHVDCRDCLAAYRADGNRIPR